MNPDRRPDDDFAARRRRARRTALWIGVVALAVYVGFLMIGILGEP
ncbi:MAG: hypothetical protein H0W24_01055 [Lysobacter sp.]|nr:hypothetical protein [Lysobacter sp.]